MLHKIQLTVEAFLIFLSIAWQPLFGMAASLAAIWYYGAMLKVNVIDKRHGGSWKRYFKSIVKRKS